MCIYIYIYETWSGHDHDLSLDSNEVVLVVSPKDGFVIC